MPLFKIIFGHEAITKYSTIIEADTEEEALEIFDEDPFGEETNEIDCEGIDIEMESISCISEEEEEEE